MYAFLARRLTARLAAPLAVLWYALLIAGIAVCYRGDSGGFVYLKL